MNTMQDALAIGTRIEEFRIEAVLGRGGFGITYLAHDTQLDRNVVLKEYMPEGFAFRNKENRVEAPTDTKAETFKWGLNRFSEEAQTLAQFRHPAIVSVQRLLASQSGTAFIVMDYLQGGNLEEKVKKEGVFDFERFRSIFASLIDGCRAVHEVDILHRDIKPLNIMMVENAPVLIDFGAARQLERQQKGAVSRIFADGYSPLEQYTSDQPQGPFTDIYALAATAYFAFTGQDPAAAPARIAGDALAPLKEVAAGRAPGKFFDAINWGMQLKVTDRPQSIDEWLPAFPDLEQKQVVIKEVVVDGIDRRTAVLGGVALGGTALAGFGGYLMTRPAPKPDISDTVRPLEVVSSRTFGPVIRDSYARIVPIDGGAYFVGHKGSGHLGKARMYAQQINETLDPIGDGYVADGQPSIGRDIAVLDDGSSLIGGAGRLRLSRNGELSSDIEITKLSTNGKKLWTKHYGAGVVNSFTKLNGNIVFASEDISLGKNSNLKIIDHDGFALADDLEVGQKSDESVERLRVTPDGDVVALNYRWRKNRTLSGSSISKFVIKDGEAVREWFVPDETYLFEHDLQQSRPHDFTQVYEDFFSIGRIFDNKASKEGGYRASYISRIDGRSGQIVFRKHAFFPGEAPENRFAARTIKSHKRGDDQALFVGAENFDTLKSQIVQLDSQANPIQSITLEPEKKRFQICDFCPTDQGAIVIGNEYDDSNQITLRLFQLAWKEV